MSHIRGSWLDWGCSVLYHNDVLMASVLLLISNEGRIVAVLIPRGVKSRSTWRACRFLPDFKPCDKCAKLLSYWNSCCNLCMSCSVINQRVTEFAGKTTSALLPMTTGVFIWEVESFHFCILFYVSLRRLIPCKGQAKLQT